MGILFPEIEIPLVVGGIFLGSNLGKALGRLGGKVGAAFANELVEDQVQPPPVGILLNSELTPLASQVIDPLAEAAYGHLVNHTCSQDSGNRSAVCNSKDCNRGWYASGCKCSACSGPMQYQAGVPPPVAREN